MSNARQVESYARAYWKLYESLEVLKQKELPTPSERLLIALAEAQLADMAIAAVGVPSKPR